MKNILFLFISFFILTGCDDGDIIVKDFDFSNSALKTCEGRGFYVFYKENPESFETLSLELSFTEDLYAEEGIKVFQLNPSGNMVHYRRHDGSVGNNYFCSHIPPSSPKVIEEYTGVSGLAEVTVQFEIEEDLYKNINSNSFEDENQPEIAERTIKKHVNILLKDLVLVKDNERIILETMDLGTIENVRVIED